MCCAASAALAVAPIAKGQAALGQPAGSGKGSAQEGPRVTGRLVGADGAPLAGVAVDGRWRDLWESNARWLRLRRASSDAAGHFVVELESGANLELWAAPSGHARKLWSRQVLVGGKDHDFGDVVFAPEAVLMVTVVDARGELLTQGWSVEALVYEEHEVGELHPDGPTYGNVTRIDAERGSVQVANLPKGHVHLIARGPLGVESNKVNVDTASGSSEHVELRYDGPDPASFVVLDVRAPVVPYASDVLWVRAADGTRRPLMADENGPVRSAAGGWSTRVRGALPGEGPWTLESIDERLRVVAQPALRPGAKLTVDLVGSSTLTLDVVDAETGRPIDAAKVTLFEVGSSRPDAMPAWISAESTVSGAVTDFVPGDYRLSIESARYASSETYLRLSRGTAHVARIELSRPVTFAGRMVDTQGQPVGGVTFSVERGRFMEWDHFSSTFVELSHLHLPIARPPFATETTRADGRFELAGLAPGPLTFRIERDGMQPEVVEAIHEASSVQDVRAAAPAPPVEQVVPVAAPTRIEVEIDLPADAEPPALGVALDAPDDPARFAELDPEQVVVVPASSEGPGPLRAVLFSLDEYTGVTVVRAVGVDTAQRWTPVGSQGLHAEVGSKQSIRFDGLALLPALVRLQATATASPAVTSLRAPWLALGLQRAGDGEVLRRFGLALLPPPPASLASQPLTATTTVPAGEYACFAGGPGWRWIAPTHLRLALLQSLDVAVEVDPPLIAREVRLEASDGTPLATTGVQLWFEGVHPLPPGERLIPVALLTDDAGRFRALGPSGAALHARVARDSRGAPLHARPAPTLAFEPKSDGSVAMAPGPEPLVLTVRAP